MDDISAAPPSCGQSPAKFDMRHENCVPEDARFRILVVGPREEEKGKP